MKISKGQLWRCRGGQQASVLANNNGEVVVEIIDHRIDSSKVWSHLTWVNTHGSYNSDDSYHEYDLVDLIK